MGFNEYYGGSTPTMKQTGALGAVKLKNQIKAIDASLELNIKNIRINGAPQGCSGFIHDPATGRYVYVHAEVDHYNQGAYYRTASGPRDYTGGRNNFCESYELAQNAVHLLRQG